MEVIEVPGLPANNTTYSQAVRMGGLLYLSGQLGMVPGAGVLVEGGIQAQTRQAIENLRTILEAAGSSLQRVGKVNIYLTDFRLLPEMNLVYAQYFPQRPAKTTVEVGALDRGALIEIEVVAEPGS